MAILAIGMTLVVSASAGTDISVGSVMSLSGGMCCMLLAGYGVTNVSEYANPLWVGIGAGILVAVVCGLFNGFLVAYLNIQPMVATTDPLVCGAGNRTAALQQRHRVCACSLLPVLRFLHRLSADADPDRGDLRVDHVADLKVYGAGDFCTECGYQ